MFTKCLIATIDEEALKQYGDYSKFSRKAFDGYKNPVGAWRAIRNPRKNGKARALYIEDLICISDTLKIPLSELFFRVEQRLKMGWQPTKEPYSVDDSEEISDSKATSKAVERSSEKADVA